jgi:ribosomal-protein-serine acetyltransferase
MPWVEHEHEPADVLPFIRATRRQIAENDGLQTAIVAPDGRLVGMVGYHSIDWLNRKSSIGYWLARDEQGRGTMTEAVRAHLDHGFATWTLNRILIQAAVENARSRAIPERLGFREEGILRQVERVGDRMLDGRAAARPSRRRGAPRLRRSRARRRPLRPRWAAARGRRCR